MRKSETSETMFSSCLRGPHPTYTTSAQKQNHRIVVTHTHAPFRDTATHHFRSETPTHTTSSQKHRACTVS